MQTKKIFNSLVKYTELLLKNWFFLISVFLDVAGIFAVLFKNLKIESSVFILIAAIGFYLAGFQIYRDFDKKLNESPFNSQKAAYEKIRVEIPNLINEMKSDLLKPGNRFKREFFVLERSWILNTREESLVYYIDDHENLEAKIRVLENYGFVIDITTSKVKKYRMTEEFVALLTGDYDKN